MLKFCYKYINLIFVCYAVFYVILFADLFILPPKKSIEKVKLFKPYSVKSGSRYTTRWSLLYKIYTQSGKMYSFGTMFPGDLVQENTSFEGSRTRLFSFQKQVITENYIYHVDQDQLVIFGLFPMVFMGIGAYIRKRAILRGVLYIEAVYFYLFSLFVILLFWHLFLTSS